MAQHQSPTFGHGIVRCESPNCGAEIPLMRSMWLCRKPNRKRAFSTIVVREEGVLPRVELEIYEPKSESEVASGTVANANATCVCCNAVLQSDRVRAQLVAQRGGADAVFDKHGNHIGGARMTAIVTIRPGEKGRQYRRPTETDYAAVYSAQEYVTEMLNGWERDGREGLCPVPDESLPPVGTLGFRVQRYGMLQWGDLFTARQKAALAICTHLLSNSGQALQLSLGKVSRHCNVISKWHTGSETVAGAFGMQTLPMSWDFPEMFPLVPYAGGLENAIEDVLAGIESIPDMPAIGTVQSADAANHPLPDQTAGVWFTDPPYYDAIPYADLSDFFLVWQKRIVPDNHFLLTLSGQKNSPLSERARNSTGRDENL